MTNFAVIENGVVTNIIVAENLPIAMQVTNKTCIEYELNAGAIGIGWNYVDGLFTPPTEESNQAVLTANISTQPLKQSDPTPILGAISK